VFHPATRTIEVTPREPYFAGVRLVRFGDAIYVYQLSGAQYVSDGCEGGIPTVYNTDRVVNSGEAINPLTVYIDLSGGDFAPGATDEPGSTDEIEFDPTGGEAGNGALPPAQAVVTGDAAADSLRAGALGINLNPTSELFSGADLDVKTKAGARNELAGGGGDDRLASIGGSATGDPAGATLRGGDGDDTLTGGSGADTLDGGPGADKLTGGAGEDMASYYGASGGVTVSLLVAEAQETGGAGMDTLSAVENLEGSRMGDVLAGDAGHNLIRGSEGDDTIDGGLSSDKLIGGDGVNTLSFATVSGGGVEVALPANANPVAVSGGAGADEVSLFDNLIGSPVGDALTGNDRANVIIGGGGGDEINGLNGPDVIEARDGERDAISCGTDNDIANVDLVGTDLVGADCETMNFAAAPPAPVVPGAEPPGAEPPPATPGAGPPVLTRLRVGRARVSFVLSAAARVTLRLDRRVEGRWKRLAAKQVLRPKRSGAHRFRLRRAWRRARLQPARYRLTAVPRNSAGAGKARRVSFRVRR